MPAPSFRGTVFAPNTDLYAIDNANRLLERHVFDRTEDSYVLSSTKTFRGRPLAITYMSVKTGFDFDGVVVTLDSPRNIRFISCPFLEIRRTVYAYGRYTAITVVPDTQSLLVVNSETASLDVINIYGVPMKRFDLPEILRPIPGLLGPVSVAFTTIGERHIVTVTSETGLVVMSVDVDKTKTLILTPRQAIKKTDAFCPIGLASLNDLLFVANGSEDEPRIHRYTLSLQDKPPEDVVISEAGEIGESDPLSICILKLDEGNFRLGGSRRHDNARGMDLLFYKNFGPED